MRARKLILLMRWSGLSIGDAVTLRRSQLDADGNIKTYRQKTGGYVFVPLPPAIAQEVRGVPRGRTSSPNYFFWNGRNRKSAIGYWWRVLRRVFDIANIRREDGGPKRCHPQMFRDTFAVELLVAGVPIDQVSKLLGHASLKPTERHYLPFVRARQEQLQRSVQQSWVTQGVDVLPTAQAAISCPIPQTPKADLIPAPKPIDDGPPAEREKANQFTNETKPTRRRAVPYLQIALLWHERKTARQIAEAIGRLDPGEDPTHTIRRILHRMRRKGYNDANGCRVKLPLRTRG
jgi:hypothetical protein